MDEFEYSDNDLDALNSDDFLALEDRAIRSTQPTLAAAPQPHPKLYGLPFGSGTNLGPNRSSVTGGNPDINSFDDEDFGQEAIDGNLIKEPTPFFGRATGSSTHGLAGESTQREQWRQERFGRPQQQQSYVRGRLSVALPHRSPITTQAEVLANQSSTSHIKNPNDSTNFGPDDVQKLQSELDRLKIEKEELQKAVTAANQQVQLKSGEISIVRSNQAKATREHERKLEELRMQQLTEISKHKLEIEQARKEKEKLATHNQFLDQEVNDQTRQLKQVQRQAKAKRTQKQAADSTPTKAKDLPFRDGFDDEEIMFVSPSKLGGRAKGGTPRAGAKRKRCITGDSPSQTLQLSEPRDGFLPDAPVLGVVGNAEKRWAQVTKEKDGFDFLPKLLNHRIEPGARRTFEVFVLLAYPSDSMTTLSSYILDQMVPLNFKASEDNLGQVGQILVSAWSKCLEEKYYEPIRYLVDMVQWILTRGTASTATFMMDELVVTIQNTVDTNIVPRYREYVRKYAIATGAPPAGALATSILSTDEELEPSDDINTNECLQLLSLTATLVSHKQEHIQRFWSLIRFDFVSTLLRSWQDIYDVEIFATILTTSIRDDSFAMIIPPAAEQHSPEKHVLDILVSMVIRVPKPLEGERRYHKHEICSLRLRILDLFEKMLTKQHSGEALARHPYVLNRLVRLMHDELNELYKWTGTHELHSELVNQATRIVYFLTRNFAAALGNLQDKLRVPPTSVYKYEIVLSRLAFGEGEFLDRFIAEDVVDCAHQMLEELVGPQEGEQLEKVFQREER